MAQGMKKTNLPKAVKIERPREFGEPEEVKPKVVTDSAEIAKWFSDNA